MEAIVGEIDMVLRTIGDMFFLSKTNYHPESFNFQEIDLVKILNEIGEQLKLIANGKNIQTYFKKQKVFILVRADKLHLLCLLINLADNAFKFTPDQGSIKIEIVLMKEKIHIRISDTGIGISRDNLTRVFEQFFHGDDKKKGAGLGLSIAQVIDKAHSCEITVQSQLSQGTIFAFILPLIRSFSLP